MAGIGDRVVARNPASSFSFPQGKKDVDLQDLTEVQNEMHHNHNHHPHSEESRPGSKSAYIGVRDEGKKG